MERLHKAINIIGYIGVLTTMLILAVNVSIRKLGWPVPGAYSIVTMVAVFVAFPAIIHAQFQRAHITIDTLKSKFSQRTIIILETFADICSVAIWGFAGWVGLKYAEKMWLAKEVLDPLRFPVAPFRFIWAIGLILLCLVILVERIQKIRNKSRQ
jgi:TRAP-type C4-dicarboxylate transport system permease small subunit